MLHRVLLILCVVSYFVACASQPLAEPQWSFEKDAIRINLKADSRLNFDDGLPHKLVLCIYQLNDTSGINQLSDDTQGIDTLLGCTLFDESVATAKRLIVHPGQDMNVRLDRAEGAKYLAMAAGYYVLRKDRMIRLYEIPVVAEKKSFFKRTKLTKPGVLDIELQLGPSQIHKK